MRSVVNVNGIVLVVIVVICLIDVILTRAGCDSGGLGGEGNHILVDHGTSGRIISFSGVGVVNHA